MRSRPDETEAKAVRTLNPKNAEAFELLHVTLKRIDGESNELESLLKSVQGAVNFIASLLDVTRDERAILKDILTYADESDDLMSVVKLAQVRTTNDLERVEVLLGDLQTQAQNLISLMHELEAEQQLLVGVLAQYGDTRSLGFTHPRVLMKDSRIEILQSRVDLLESKLARPWPLLIKFALRNMARSTAEFLNAVSLPVPRVLANLIESQDPLHTASASLDQVYSKETALIVTRYFPPGFADPPVPLHMQLGSAELARAYCARNRRKRANGDHILSKGSGPNFSIVTPFYAHLEYFKSCAGSVEAVRKHEGVLFEWIVVNDDPAVTNDSLLNSIPLALRARCRVVGGESNEGISRALDRGIRESRYDWIVLLDCDDMLEPQALQSANTAIREYPTCRYFSSLMSDIDEHGTVLRRRQDEGDILDLFGSGMVAGHMVMFERSLFDEIGGFDARFSGVQDYDFALRVQATDEIVRIPEHLYCYRWHQGTQSVVRMLQQTHKANAARVAFLREGVKLRSNKIDLSPLSRNPEIFCVIRTQGNRMDLLSRAISSVRDQRYPVTPCIVVHADDEVFEFVQRHLRSDLELGATNRAAVVLHAPRTDLRRGYPCNVALDYLKAHRSNYDLLCFLDDDDHLLPNFAERLTDMLLLRGSAMAYGMANALPKMGQPFVQHELRPWLSIVDSNFIVFNSFLVRLDAVLDAGITFETGMHYLEDHHFLLQMAGAGIRAEPLMEVITEYRLLGDGNAAIKRDITHFEECHRIVKGLAEYVVRKLSIDEFWDDLLAFPCDEDRPDPASVKRAYKMFADGGRARV